ncbi:probable serine/threonine-protein kinase PBL21 [Macadamia integrifolia]|uniref:probable serine/threonine-protein kinase PBL21 n=1 Tax=Macadamia integrifolia TaxID=60698 RepID=UPI001C4FF349|nr:probable serine/threonine-protein kinase PBL21 [Macadamia integrifolia]XP_042510826.1 probable serine/threonine-protein kinase PBL21 [Macadamia integrifolia]XP_042510827.1 probable serine/threonine-protein kinase PBL21 [Macadamia integrifolia]XP_042510828.1 probable serine/threonine-protein kinase PBL21 [Macadamia integrifolia]XP_042510829.1 probable serine/threonine-protein kinase PBL21 [Macadamia integrifolia]
MLEIMERAIISLLHGAPTHCSHTASTNLSPSSLTSSPVKKFILFQSNLYKSRKTRIAATVGGDNGVPTLTPSQTDFVERPGKQRLATIVGGSAVGALLLVIIAVLVFIYLLRAKRFVRRTSETESSAASTHVDCPRENGSRQAGTVSSYETQNLRQLTIAELEHATSHFSQINVVGEGGFGIVYKGLLQDGSIVAIKRRVHEPSLSFIYEVENIGHIHHKHTVRLIGYCQESHQQLLVYEYLPNGNVGNHLYDSEGFPIGKLDIGKRLSIALGTARGLEYLHSLEPPLLHMHFQTSNVLVDENFAAKVSDFGISKLVEEGNWAGSSSSIDCFLDPELRLKTEFSEKSDVYSFGVFLLELLSGHEASSIDQSGALRNLVAQACCPNVKAKDIHVLESLVDKALLGKAEFPVKLMMELVVICVGSGERRPTMKWLVAVLELIQERRMDHVHTGLGKEIDSVTLGSELFK